MRFHYCAFKPVFPLLFIVNRIIILHDVGLLDTDVELDGLTSLYFAAGTGLIFFMYNLCSVLFGVLLKYFTLPR